MYRYNSRVIQGLLAAVASQLMWLSPLTAEQLQAPDQSVVAADIPGTVSKHIRELGDPRWSIRRGAAKALGSMGISAVGPLIEALADEDVEIRVGASVALGDAGAHPAVDPLLSMLIDKDQADRLKYVAAEALAKIGEPAVVPLSDLLESKQQKKAGRWAAYAMIFMPDHRVVAPLLYALKKGDGEAKDWAKIAIVQPREAAAIEPLAGVLKDLDEDEDIRALAAEALGNISDTIVYDILAPALVDEKRKVRSAAGAALGKLGDERAIDPIAEALDKMAKGAWKSGYHFSESWAYIEALKEFDDPRVLPSLIRVFGHPQGSFVGADPTFRAGLSQAIRKYGDSAVDRLIDSLTDEKTEVRAWSAYTLGEMGSPKAVEPLTAALDDREEDVRNRAAVALTKIDAVQGDPAHLVSLLNYKDEAVKYAAAETLARGGHAKGKEFLLYELKQGRKLALTTLTEAGDTSITSDLIKMLYIPDRYHPPSGPAIQNAALLLGARRSPQALGPMLLVLETELREEVRLTVVEALGWLGDNGAIEPLTRLLQNEKSKYIRAMAVRSLGALGGADSIELLITALDDRDSEVRFEAAYALGHHRPGRALAVLRDALDDKSYAVRWAAALSLSRYEGEEVEDILAPALRAKDSKRSDSIIAGAHRYFIRRGEWGTEQRIADVLSKNLLYSKAWMRQVRGCGKFHFKKPMDGLEEFFDYFTAGVYGAYNRADLPRAKEYGIKRYLYDDWITETFDTPTLRWGG